jgi:hypothetical protein
MRYDFIQKGFAPTDVSFNKKVYSVVKSLYISTLDKTYTNINPLKAKWDKIVSKEQLESRKVFEGFGNIVNAFSYVHQNNIKFSDVDHSYILEIPGSKITITGQLDPFIDKGRYIEVFISHFGKKQPDKADIDKKLKHTIDAYVLKQLYDKDVVFKYHCFTTDKEYITTRSTKDFNRLKNIVTQIGLAINNNIIYPRETFMCGTCCYLDMCKSWGSN